jgi:hypothetical protein
MVGTHLGHYLIERKLGEGGMGEVYLATDTNLGRQVALKVLTSSLASDPDGRERFEREARAAAALNHPNIVTIHSVENIGGIPILTLGLIDGQTLAELIPPSKTPCTHVLLVTLLSLPDFLSGSRREGATTTSPGTGQARAKVAGPRRRSPEPADVRPRDPAAHRHRQERCDQSRGPRASRRAGCSRSISSASRSIHRRCCSPANSGNQIGRPRRDLATARGRIDLTQTDRTFFLKIGYAWVL